MTVKPLQLLASTVAVNVERAGTGRLVMLLHGGAGPASMRPLLAGLGDHDVLLPTHPGFDDSERPAWLNSVSALATCYLALIDVLALRDVVLVGNSVGGWIAAEVASRQSPAVAGIVLIDAVGLEPTSTTGPILNPLKMKPDELARAAFADPAKAQPPSPQAAERTRANQQVLLDYAGSPYMNDPTLAARLADIEVPALALWGDHDGIVGEAYGRDLARRIAGASFELVRDAGHLPQIEQPEAVASRIKTFIAGIGL